MEEVFLTGQTEIDFKILQELDLKSLNRICQANEYVKNSICSDNYFWLPLLCFRFCEGSIL